MGHDVSGRHSQGLAVGGLLGGVRPTPGVLGDSGGAYILQPLSVSHQ